MLSVQPELFERTTPKGEFLGSGCYSRVWANDGHSTVTKLGRSLDGTFAWLYYCYESQRAGKNLKGMPQVYSLVRKGSGYLVVMKQYETLLYAAYRELGSGFGYGSIDGMEEGYMKDLAVDWLAAAKRYEPLWGSYGASCCYMNDAHRGNVMWDSENKHMVLTDPSCTDLDVDEISMMHLLLCDTTEFSLTLQ